MEVGDGEMEEVGTNSYDHLMYTQNAEIIEPFSSHVVLAKAGRAHTGECINIMVQVLWTEDGSLPQGLTMQSMYTKLRQGSKKAVMVVRNNTTYSQTLQKKTPVARAVAALPVPKPLRKGNYWRGLLSPMIPISLVWQLGKDMVNCLTNWT